MRKQHKIVFIVVFLMISSCNLLKENIIVYYQPVIEQKYWLFSVIDKENVQSTDTIVIPQPTWYQMQIPIPVFIGNISAEGHYCYTYSYPLEKDTAYIVFGYNDLAYWLVNNLIERDFPDSVFQWGSYLADDIEQSLYNWESYFCHGTEIKIFMDTLDVSGQTKKMCWRAIFISGKICAAYYNVPIKYKAIFNNCINSLSEVESGQINRDTIRDKVLILKNSITENNTNQRYYPIYIEKKTIQVIW